MNRIFVILIISAVILMISGCQNRGVKTPVRIGIIKPSIDHLPLSLALEKEYLKPTKYELVNFTSGWEVQEAITAGRLDLAIMPFTYAWSAVAKGYKLKISCCLERETDGVLAPVSVQDIKELNNQKIGLLRASTLDILMQDTAKIKDITYTPVYFRTPTEMIAALKSNDVSAIVCYVPLIQKMGTDYHVLHWFSETYPFHPCCDLVITEDINTAYPKLIKEITAGLVKAISDIENPSEETYKLVSDLYGLDQTQTDDALLHTRFAVCITESDKQFELQMMESFLKSDYLKKMPDIKDVYLD